MAAITPWTDEDREILLRGLANRTNNLGTLMRDERRDAELMAGCGRFRGYGFSPLDRALWADAEGWHSIRTSKARAPLPPPASTCMEYAPNGGWQRLSYQIKVF